MRRSGASKNTRGGHDGRCYPDFKILAFPGDVENTSSRLARPFCQQVGGAGRSTIDPSFIITTSSHRRSTSMLCDASRIVAPRSC